MLRRSSFPSSLRIRTQTDDGESVFILLLNILFSLFLVVVNIIMMIVTMLTFRFVGMDLPVSEQINIGELFGQSGLCGISVRRSSCKNINGLLMRK